MDPKATVQALMDAVQNGELDKAGAMLTPDFQFSGPVPEPISGPAWMGMSAALKKAFPDLNYHFKAESADGDSVSITAKLEGTHTGELDLTAMHMGVIPPTNKPFSAAKETGKAMVKGDKVSAWITDKTEGAGLMAILGQLGIQVPAM
jgi:predicted ester cyclase